MGPVDKKLCLEYIHRYDALGGSGGMPHRTAPHRDRSRKKPRACVKIHREAGMTICCCQQFVLGDSSSHWYRRTHNTFRRTGGYNISPGIQLDRNDPLNYCVW